MLFKVRVITNAKKALVTKIDDNEYEVKVDERPVDGSANKRLLEILSDYLGIKKSQLLIVRGSKSRVKLIEVTL
jgi:uncharacterized protein (TIGR00251 family)